MDASLHATLLQKKDDLSWRWIFGANVFFGCVAFSIVMPNLWLYLETMNSTKAFYALVVASFSTGEAVGALGIGALSNYVGTKRALFLCSSLGVVGGTSYALAFTIFEVAPSVGPYAVLVGRLLQGIGAGGRQAVEQAYTSFAAPPEKLTELTSMLSTVACMGFIFGPVFGALAGLVPAFQIGPVVVDAYTFGGWLCATLDVGIILNLACRFTEIPRRSEAASDGAPTAGGGSEQPASTAGVWACIFFFFVHFNGFALQETITTPLVQEWFGWDEMHANLLFTAAGIANLVCSAVMAWLSAPVTTASGLPGTQRVSDRALLALSMALAAAGWVLMVPVGGPMGVGQFLAAFTLVTVAFPFGRGVCLATAGKLLGDQPQGTWMGIMFALGSIARVVGPFWAVQGFLIGPLAVFGVTGVLFLASLGLVRLLWAQLAAEPSSPLAKTATPLMRARRNSASTPTMLLGSPTTPRPAQQASN